MKSRSVMVFWICCCLWAACHSSDTWGPPASSGAQCNPWKYAPLQGLLSLREEIAGCLFVEQGDERKSTPTILRKDGQMAFWKEGAFSTQQNAMFRVSPAAAQQPIRFLYVALPLSLQRLDSTGRLFEKDKQTALSWCQSLYPAAQSLCSDQGNGCWFVLEFRPETSNPSATFLPFLTPPPKEWGTSSVCSLFPQGTVSESVFPEGSQKEVLKEEVILIKEESPANDSTRPDVLDGGRGERTPEAAVETPPEPSIETPPESQSGPLWGLPPSPPPSCECTIPFKKVLPARGSFFRMRSSRAISMHPSQRHLFFQNSSYTMATLYRSAVNKDFEEYYHPILDSQSLLSTAKAKGILSGYFGPKGDHLLLAGGYNMTLFAISLQDDGGTEKVSLNNILLDQTMTGVNPSFYDAVFSPDGQYLVTAFGEELHVWEFTAGKWTPTSYSPLKVAAASKRMAISPDGKLLAVGISNAKVFLYSLSDGKEVWKKTVVKNSSIGEVFVSFSPDGKYLGTGVYGLAVRPPEIRVLLWKRTDMTQPIELVRKGKTAIFTDALYNIAFSASGASLFVSGSDKAKYVTLMRWKRDASGTYTASSVSEDIEDVYCNSRLEGFLAVSSDCGSVVLSNGDGNNSITTWYCHP